MSRTGLTAVIATGVFLFLVRSVSVEPMSGVSPYPEAVHSDSRGEDRAFAIRMERRRAETDAIADEELLSFVALSSTADAMMLSAAAVGAPREPESWELFMAGAAVKIMAAAMRTVTVSVVAVTAGVTFTAGELVVIAVGTSIVVDLIWRIVITEVVYGGTPQTVPPEFTRSMSDPALNIVRIADYFHVPPEAVGLGGGTVPTPQEAWLAGLAAAGALMGTGKADVYRLASPFRP